MSRGGCKDMSSVLRSESAEGNMSCTLFDAFPDAPTLCPCYLIQLCSNYLVRVVLCEIVILQAYLI